MIDHFLGAQVALALREQAVALYRERPALFTGGAVGGGRDGEGDRYSHAKVRGDKMVILQTDDSRLPLIKQLTEKMDALVQQLAAIGGAGCAELRAVDHRSSPMFAIYPGQGTRYMRHVDNPDGNGRLLTLLYYLNPCWTTPDGGELRLWLPPTDTRLP